MTEKNDTDLAPENEPRTLSEKAREWLRENKDALDGSNAYVERHGLPLAHYRRF